MRNLEKTRGVNRPRDEKEKKIKSDKGEIEGKQSSIDNNQIQSLSSQLYLRA